MKALLAAVAFAGTALFSVAHAAPALPAEVAQDLFVKSGLEIQVGQLSQVMQNRIGQDESLKKQLGEEGMDRFVKAYTDAFATTRLSAVARTRIAAELPAPAAKASLAWLDSDVGKRISALEEKANNPDEYEARLAASVSLFERLPPRRVERYQRLTRAVNLGEGSASMVINLSLAMVRGVFATSGRPAGNNLSDVKKELEAERGNLTETLGTQGMVFSAGAYETLSEGELDQYIAFAESDAGRAYHLALIRVLESVVDDAAANAAKVLEKQRSEAAA